MFTPALRAMESAINHALALDENLAEKLTPVVGKTLQIEIKPFNIHFFIHFKPDHLLLSPTHDEPAQAILSSTLLDLIRLTVLPTPAVRTLFRDKIQLSGEVEVGQNLKKIIDDLDLDWEGHLSRLVGDVAAYQMGSFFRRCLASKQQFSASLPINLSEYVQEELQLLPPQEAVADFFNDIDALILDVDRLAAQITQLSTHHENN